MIRSFLLCFLVFFGVTLFALDASVSYSVFKKNESSYVEIYTYILANSLEHRSVEQKSKQVQAAVDILIFIKDNEDIIAYDKYRLFGPSVERPLDFSDIRRLSVPQGNYTLEVEITDAYNPQNLTLLQESLEVNFQGVVQQSGIQLLASFSESEEVNSLVKNGFKMEPIPFHYFNKKYNTLSFYTEVYHEEEEQEFYIITYVISKLGKQGEREEKIRQFKRRKVKPLDPILMQLDISKIESGDYVLTVSVINAQKEAISESEAFFIRANPEYDYLKSIEYAKVPEDEKDFTEKLDSAELRYALKSIVPVISPSDAEVLNIVISKGDRNAMRMFLFNHYEALFPDNPVFAYNRYMDVAKAVDKMYKNGFGHGFETDRGYFFLKYGKPDDIREVIDDPSAPPYEIWFYNTLLTTNQNNVRFVFYNPSLIENGHVLLHSTARGEWNNPKWEVMLYNKANTDIQGGNPVDGTRMQDNFGKQARRMYNDF